MSRLGYPACDVAHDGEEAVEKCRRTSYDLVLMDLQVFAGVFHLIWVTSYMIFLGM
jgi:hypothetical protein